MTKLLAELQRLYFLPEQTGECRIDGEATLGPLSPALAEQTLAAGGSLLLDAQNPAGEQRLLCLAFSRTSDWPHIASLLDALINELDLPAPAVSIDGQGHRLWFSLAQPVAATQAQRFLDGLCQRYLSDIPPARVHPGSETPIPLPPAPLADGERWTAFIDPDMGSMFTDEAWLDMRPGLDRQADLLAACKSISITDFNRALNLLFAPQAESTAKAPTFTVDTPETAKISQPYSDPKSFLLAVMNDPGISLTQRIEAAKALLPYCTH